MTYRHAFLAFVLMVWGTAHAQDKATQNLNPKLTVQALIQMAVDNNPELQALRLDSQSAIDLSEQSGRWQNPNLNFGYDKKNQPVGDTTLTRVGISQLIPAPGKMKSLEQKTKAIGKIASLQQKKGEVHLRIEVLRLIYIYQAAKEKATHAQERLERFKTVGTYLRSRVFAAPQKQAEAMIVRAKILTLNKSFRQLQAEANVAWGQLNLYLGLPSEPSIEFEWAKSWSRL